MNAQCRSSELVAEEAEDRPFLARLYASTRLDEPALLPWSMEQKRGFLEMQFEAQDRHYRNHHAETERCLIRIDGKRAGRLYLDRRSDEIRIVDIALLPDYRGGGVGTTLLKQVQAEAGAQAKVVRIHVEKNNPAYRLYFRLGFVTIEDKGVYDLLEWRCAVDEQSPEVIAEDGIAADGTTGR